MTELYAIVLFLFVLFVLLGSGVWVGLALMGVAWVGMELFTTRPVGDRRGIGPDHLGVHNVHGAGDQYDGIRASPWQ